MKTLVINSGSSSIKYKLFEMQNETVLAAGVIERIGDDNSNLEHKKYPDTQQEGKTEFTEPVPDHAAGLKKVVALLTHADYGVIQDRSEIKAVGHRVVHGGESFHTPSIIDEATIEAIEANASLAPLHNPANLTGIKVAREIFPDVPQVAIFDTAFHQSMPAKAYQYAIPYALYKELGIRRYGFHGTSHRYVAKKAAALLGKKENEVNLITVHLGNGSSMCAIQNGKCVDTSLGMTPLAGLVMGTRCGDIDPAVHAFLAKQKQMSIEEIDELLNKESGLKGICGMNDMRDIHNAREKGDSQAQLALEMLTYRNKKYIGSYLAALGRVDGIVFTAGIGENDPDVRALSVAGLENFGIEIDQTENAQRKKGARYINTDASRVKIMIVPTDEELEIAQQTMEILAA